MVTLFRTGHELNERVCDALAEGFSNDDIAATYGVLRGSGEWAKEQCDWFTKPKGVLMADKGYWKPGHFNGYYRLAWNGTQALWNTDAWPAKLGGFNKRLEELGLEIEPWQNNERGHILVCPHTTPVAHFYGGFLHDGDRQVGERTAHSIVRGYGNRWPVIVRTKDCQVPLEDHLKGCRAVMTFNSAVGWEALRRGIPCISSAKYSTVGSYLGTGIADLGRDLTECDRYPLFSFMANRQFTLAEISNGTARRYLL